VPADRPVHSLHAYFLRPGDPAAPIVYAVDRIRDGRSFTTRRVVATQHGKALFTLSASFHVAEDGANHQFTMPDVPAPDDVPLWQDRLREFGDRVPARWLRPRPVEVRYIGDPPWGVRDPAAAGNTQTMVWMRAVGPLPDDPLLHVCAAAYASDMTLLDSVLVAQRLAWSEGTGTRTAVTGASLDHAMWFHAPFRADDWLFYDQEGTWAGSSRALCRGSLFDRSGTLVASVVQEGLVRVRRQAGR
jgi:acyl-CoA thioesterase II